MNQELPTLLQAQQYTFKPVVHFDPAKQTLLALDFTGNNTTLTGDILKDTNTFSAYITNQLRQAGATYGIGGYAEHRTVYSRSKVFDAASPGAKPRRLHLGTDIWGKPHTAVMAPMDGIVHSFAFNNQFGDYGVTIILTHHIETFSFHTLYGHLSLSSIGNMSPGDRIRAGEVFAEFGVPYENGHWPPHLHFQVVVDMEAWKGDYPGVCAFSEKERWLANSPDPDLILQMNQYVP